MEVNKPMLALLSNYEVLALLKESKQNSKSQKRLNSNQNLATICYETKQYLEQTPCKNQSPEVIDAFIKAVNPFKLTKCEKLQILNLKPTDAGEIQLVVEESEERLSEDDVNNLIDAVVNTLPDSQAEKMET